MKNRKRILTLIFALLLMAGTVTALAAESDAVTLMEQPADDPDHIKIVKESDGKAITDQEAIFKVEFFPNENCSGSPARTWYYKTVKGYTVLNDKTYFLASWSGGKSDALYENAAGLPTLPLGSIRVTEAQAPAGYLKALFKLEGKITQAVPGGDAAFAWTTQADGTISYKEDAAHVQNNPIRGNLKIVKRDAHGDTPLPGAGFRVTDTAGKTVAEGVTNAQGEITFNDLVYGDYFYQETTAPLGFALDETKYPLSIRENGVTITKEQTDQRREGTLQVKKQNTQGGALSGAVFLLEYSPDGITWAPVSSRSVGGEVTVDGCTSPGLTDGQLTTGADGTVTFTGLRADGSTRYRLTETAAPEGMSLLGSPLYIGTLPAETGDRDAADSQEVNGKTYCYTLYVTASDSYVFRLPLTGSSGFAWLPFAMVLTAAPLIILNTKRRKRSQ